MSAWKQSLTAAGVREPGLRRDYGEQRRMVARFRRSSYLAARVLLPRPLLPHVVAATALMHHGDNLLDTGPKPQRAAAWAAWEQEVRTALDTGKSADPLLRALLHTVRARPRLRGVVEAYLATATAELEFTGFATEADYQAYLDAYSLPAFMLVAALVGPESEAGAAPPDGAAGSGAAAARDGSAEAHRAGPQEAAPGREARYRAACRTFIDGSQRLDFVNDLAEDLREGRLGIPEETLARFSVSSRDLAAGRATDGVRALLADQIGRARAGLESARGLRGLVPAANRPLVGALVEIELLTAEAALARGDGLLRGSAGPSPLGALRVLRSARREAARAH